MRRCVRPHLARGFLFFRGIVKSAERFHKYSRLSAPMDHQAYVSFQIPFVQKNADRFFSAQHDHNPEQLYRHAGFFGHTRQSVLWLVIPFLTLPAFPLSILSLPDLPIREAALPIHSFLLQNLNMDRSALSQLNG